MENENLERLRAMSTDNGQTWDLSDNDQAAIKWALNAISVLSDIVKMTNADDEKSYRSDDREGCLDAVHHQAWEAIK